MNKFTLSLLLLCIFAQCNAYSDQVGYISGILLLDNSWDRTVYLSVVETFEKEYSITNNLIVESSKVDSLGNFRFKLDKLPTQWSLLRLHLVKKGVSRNSLVIGSRDENFYFIIAKRDSEIIIYNTEDKPIFSNTKVLGASYMTTFEYLRNLSTYPNSIDYENSLIEKEFIEDVVAEKLREIADTCSNSLVSLYALYQTDFQANYKENPNFYLRYLSKWKNENSTYFSSFRSKFPGKAISSSKIFPNYILLLASLGIVLVIGLYSYSKRNRNFEKLSIQERKIFDLLRKGMSNKEISAECNIELSTVKSHISSIYSKLKVKSRKDIMNLKRKKKST